MRKKKQNLCKKTRSKGRKIEKPKNVQKKPHANGGPP
jgi:hypothetical protein